MQLRRALLDGSQREMFARPSATRRKQYLGATQHATQNSPAALAFFSAFDTIPPLGSQEKMSHTSREKLDLVSRTKKVIGQLESVLRALNEDAPCADILQRLSAARGAINSLMGELMEDHIRHHMPRNTKSAEEAADDIIDVVRTYLK